ncbi:hypothetical protein HanIR_Chr04g0178161 [Helianthus annuus]|nr:hypothetical protein HanIR_Chr04g0178161 [Helianthus annuus]
MVLDKRLFEFLPSQGLNSIFSNLLTIRVPPIFSPSHELPRGKHDLVFLVAMASNEHPFHVGYPSLAFDGINFPVKSRRLTCHEIFVGAPSYFLLALNPRYHLFQLLYFASDHVLHCT